MDQTTKVALITGFASVLAALITTTLPLYTQNRKLKKEIRYVTTGMVVAYFFSFIKPLFEKLEIPEVVIKDETEQYQKLLAVNKRLELVIPKTLDYDGYKKAKSYTESKFRKGVLMHNSEVIFKDIKYRTENGTTNAIILIDTPNILESAVNYFKESMRTPDFSISEDFKKITQKELANFRQEIDRMILNSEFAGKVDIVQI